MTEAWKRMGLVLRGSRLYWGYEHGALRWTPYWFRNAIVHGWNQVACRLLGHFALDERLNDGHCVYCCKSVE